MSRKIQVTVDEKLERALKKMAANSGLSVSSFVRLALIRTVKSKNDNLLDQALADIKSGNVEKISLSDFKKELDDK